MLDPDADLGRRAWLPCPRCRADDCVACNEGSTCGQHWLHLLANEARLVFVQCPGCRYRWWYDTECGVGDRPPGHAQLPDFPASPGQAA